MKKGYQISAHISESTREKMEQYSRQTGVKKGHLVEEALLHHLQALQELPADVVIHPRVVVTRESFEKIVDSLEKAKPNKALLRLMKHGNKKS